MTRLSPQTILQRKAKKLLEMWEKQGLSVGGIKIEGSGDNYSITILTPEAASNEVDPYAKWKDGQDAA